MLTVPLLSRRRLKTIFTAALPRGLFIRAILATSVLLVLSFSTLLAADQIRGWMNIKSHSTLEPHRKSGFKSALPSVSVASNCSAPLLKPLFDPTPMTWNWTQNVATTTNPTSVVKSSGIDTRNDAYAYSIEALTADGDSVQWTMASSFRECSVSLSSVYSDANPEYPNFWVDFYYGRDENYYCTEGWADNGPGTIDCSSSYSTSTVFKFIRRCDRVELYVNDVEVWERIGTLPAQLYVVFQAGQLSAGANDFLLNSQPPACSCPNIPIVP